MDPALWRSPFVRAPAPKLKGAEHFMVKIRNHAGCNDCVCATAGEKVRQGSAPLLAALAVAGVGSRSPLAVR